MPTEANLSKQCVKYARILDVLVWKTEAVGRRGFPDLTVLFPSGHVMFVELKHPNGKGTLSALQEKTINEMRAHNADVHVLDSLSTFSALIQERLNLTTKSSNRPDLRSEHPPHRSGWSR